MRNDKGVAFWRDKRCAGGGYRLTENRKDQEHLDRLAAYEDTGLSPETVSDLLERFTYFYRTVEGLDLVDPVHFGAFVDRVKRWQQAEKDGRLVVLEKAPPKVGDTIYEVVENNAILENQVEYIDLNRMTCCASSDEGGLIEFYLFEIGKTVFITREEAEAEMKKREGGAK